MSTEPRSIKLLHFADAHIDMANYGRHDPETGLPLRVLDFLKSLDEIVNTAISEQVDLVLFAGDAYRDRSPAPTYQREWGRRIIRLSKAGIRTLLLVGNHDLSPAVGRATALQEFDTLAIPNVTVLDKPRLLTAEEIGLPLQVIALPWVSRSGLLAATDTAPEKVHAVMEEKIAADIHGWLKKADPALPIVLAAHASIEGAKLGSERTIMLGADMVLPASLVKDGRLDYVALGHIHKAQDLNEGSHPPVIYPGSIERVDWGEAADEKFFVLANVEKGATRVQWKKLEHIRPFIDRQITLTSEENVGRTLREALPDLGILQGAIVRLTVDYPRDWDALINESEIRKEAEKAFEFHLVKRPQIKARMRLPGDKAVGSMSPMELLDQYWLASQADPEEVKSLRSLANKIIAGESEENIDPEGQK